MTADRISNRLLFTLGGGLIVSGWLLAFIPILIDEPFAIRPGFLGPIAVGIGLCLVLTATVRWLMSPIITVDTMGVPVERAATNVSHDWSQRAKLAVELSAVAAVMSPALFIGGFVWGFTIPIADGGLGAVDDGMEILSFMMIITGFFLGLFGLLSNLYGIIAGWHTWKTSGSRGWFIAALILPALPVLIFAVFWSTL